MEDENEETCYACEQRRVALWATAALIAGVWAVALAVLTLAWGVAR